MNKVFSSDYAFSIPDYQRPYRWGSEQVTQLLDDLIETMDRGRDEPYFLGSLVLVSRPGGGFDVIDGQQRLTTLTILFAVLRDLAENADFARQLGGRIVEPGSELDGIVASARLKLRSQDAAFFERHIQTHGGIESLITLTSPSLDTEAQVAIRDNARTLYERLRTWDDERRRRLAILASTRTYLVVVSTPDLDSAYRIFSVMNARGLDLTPADIFKSRVIGQTSAERDFDKRWEQAEEALGSAAFTDLFRDIRTVVSGERSRQELLTEFPRQVLNFYLESGRAGEFVDDLLLPYARAFERTVRFEFGADAEWQVVGDWLRRLAMIDNKDWRPCALWALVEHGDDPSFLAQFLGRLERLAASFLLQQVYTTPRIGRYLDLLNELKHGRGIDAPSFELTEEERSRSLLALQGDVYRMQPRRARYVLLRLDELLAKSPGATYNHAIISIEHVLPQNPADGSGWERLFSVQDRERLTHRLGNLVLLNNRKNSQASRAEFSEKKRRYFTTSSGSAVFAITTKVLEHEVWSPAVVEERQVRLVRILAREWNLEPATERRSP